MLSWVFVGAGNLIGDLVDAVRARQDVVRCVLTNQPLPAQLIVKIDKMGVPIISLEDYTPLIDQFLFGFLNPNKEEFLDALARRRSECESMQNQFLWTNLIHPKAYVANDVDLGSGNYLAANSVVGSSSKLERHIFINRAASVGHDTHIGNFTHIGPGATVCGNCQLGEKVYVGAGSTIIDGIKIVNGTTVGAGAVVTKNIETAGVYIGVPAKLKV